MNNSTTDTTDAWIEFFAEKFGRFERRLESRRSQYCTQEHDFVSSGDVNKDWFNFKYGGAPPEAIQQAMILGNRQRHYRTQPSKAFAG